MQDAATKMSSTTSLCAQMRVVNRGLVEAASTGRAPGVLAEKSVRLKMCGPWDLAMPGEMTDCPQINFAPAAAHCGLCRNAIRQDGRLPPFHLRSARTRLCPSRRRFQCGPKCSQRQTDVMERRLRLTVQRERLICNGLPVVQNAVKDDRRG